MRFLLVKPVEEMTLRHFDWTMALNVRAFYNLVRLLLPRFAEGGSILAVSSEGAARAVPLDRRLEETVRRTPVGRLVDVQEVAAAAQFLCSDAASGIVGHTLVVDGGCRILG